MELTSNKELQDQTRVNKFESQYGEYIEAVAESMEEKYNYQWTNNDSIAFGEYAENWEAFKPVLESDMTTRELIGPALSSNMGIIAMSYAGLPIQNLASVQPLNDEAGTVYYRRNVAETTRAGVTAGDELVGSTGKVNQSIGNYVSENATNTQAIADTAVLTYTAELGLDVKPGKVTVDLAGKIKGFDDGEGHIIGVGIDGDASVVNYATGAVSITFASLTGKSVAVADVLTISYANNTVEGASGTIPTSKWILDSKVVQTNYYVLQSSYSTLSEFVVRKRFGTELQNEVTADLVTQINSGVMFNAITELRNASIANEVVTGTPVQWTMAAGTGVADVDYRATFDDTIIDATAEMYKIAGRGDVSAMVVGTKGKKVLKTAGMKIIKSGVSGPHLCGDYDGVPVYYAPNTVLGENEVLVVYRGQNWYEAPMTYSPFLPVTTVRGQNGKNILENQAKLVA